MATDQSIPHTRPLTVERQPNSPAVLFRDERGVVVGGVWGPSADDMDGTLALARTMAGAELMRAAIRAFVSHHDNGQAGQPGHPKTYGEQDIWLAEWDRRYAALKAAAEVQP